MSTVKKVIYIIVTVILFVVIVQIVVADKYSATLQVVEGENVMGVNPLAEKLDFGDLARETSAIRYVSLENNGGMDNYIMVWKFGSISELIKISRNNFTLAPNDKERLEFQLFVPVSATTGERYEGSVWIFKIPQIW